MLRRFVILIVAFGVAAIAIEIFAILTGTFGVDIHWR
jgi:hypothetical protein